MRIITSTSAAARLDAARAFLAGRPPATELIIVGASRGAADDFARAIARHAGATFGITRFSLTELAARAAAARPGRRAPRARHAGRRRSDGRARGVRRARRRRARVLRAGGAHARLSEGAGAHAARAPARRRRRRTPTAERRTTPPIGDLFASAGARRRRTRRVGRRRSRGAVPAGGRGLPRRPGALGARCRSCCSTCRSTRAPSRSSPRR